MNTRMKPTMFDIGPGAFLTALRMADTALPTGLFTQSHGLETYVHTGRVRDGDDVRKLLESYLIEQIAPADAVAAAAAWRAAEADDVEALVHADRELGARKLCRETREGSARSGGRLLRLAHDLTANPLLAEMLRRTQAKETPGHYATVSGAVSAVSGIPLDAALLMEVYSFAASFVGAAMRLLRYDHLEAQRTLTELQPLFERLVADAVARNLEEMRSFSPLAEVMSMQHEHGHVRMFSS